MTRITTPIDLCKSGTTSGWLTQVFRVLFFAFFLATAGIQYIIKHYNI